MIIRNRPDPTKFNPGARLPYELRVKDFELGMQDVYDFFYDVNTHLLSKGLERLDDMLRRAIMSGLLAGRCCDTHGARAQWLCVFVYAVDRETEPASARRPMTFTEIYLAKVEITDFRKNPRSELGTRTATLDREGVKKLRAGWVYKL